MQMPSLRKPRTLGDRAIEAVESIVREYYLRKHAPAAPSAKSFNINCLYQLISFVGYSKEINIA
jgi:hypothetical protein